MKKLVMMTCVAILLSGCQSGQDEASTSETVETESAAVSERVTRQRSVAGEAAQLRAQAQGDPSRNIPRLQGQFAQDGMGLLNIVDGSSPEAFAQSLELIAAETSEAQYMGLDSSLRFLRMHSSAGWSGLPALYQSLDGMSGEEIIEHADRLARERGR